MVFSLLIELFIPSNNVFAINSETIQGENEAAAYEVSSALKDDKQAVDVTLTLHPKENITVHTIALLNGGTQEFNGNSVQFTATENGTIFAAVYYQENDNTEENASKVQKVEIPIEIKGIEKVKKENLNKQIKQGNFTEQVGNNENVKANNASITNLTVTRLATGTEAFDADDTAGNDSSAVNEIVRSNDELIYQANITGENFPKEEVGLKFKAELNVPKKYAQFDETTLNEWLKDIKQEDVDGKCVLTGTAKLKSDNEATNFTKTLVVNVKSMKQGDVLTPTFNIEKQTGSDDFLNKTMNAENEKVIVSAKPMFDIELVQGGQLNALSTYDFSLGNTGAPNNNQGEVYGRMIDFGVAVRINSNDTNKGLKGLYLPEDTEEMTFTIKPTVEGETIKPLLWDYKENTYGNNGKNGRDLTTGLTGSTLGYCGKLPLSNKNYGGTDYEVYNGGAWTMVQNPDGTISVKINGSKVLDENGVLHAPAKMGNRVTNLGQTPNQGNVYISTAYFSVVVPIDENPADKAYNLVMEDQDMKIPYEESDGKKMTSNDMQSVKNNDIHKTIINTEPVGTYSMHHYYVAANQTTGFYGSNLSTSKMGMGLDAYTMINSQIEIGGAFSYSGDSNGLPNAVNYLMKFDDEAFKPSENLAQEALVIKPGFNYDLTVLYAGKPDGTGWSSDQEMQSTREEDLVYYKSIEELEQDGKVCVGLLTEFRNITQMPTGQQMIGFNVDVLDSAKAGSVYQTVHMAYYYDKSKNITVDDTRYSNNVSLKLNNPTKELMSSEIYEKAKYDEDYIVTNTANQNTSYQRGASILIVGVEASVNKEVEGNALFDIASGISQIPYVIKPVLNTAGEKTGSIVQEVQVIDILPKYLKVTDNTEYYYGGKAIQAAEVTKQADGTTRIVWNFEKVSTNTPMSEIKFKADIDFNEIDFNEAHISLTNKVQIKATGDNREVSEKWTKSPNTDKADAQIILNSALGISKTISTPYVEVNDKIQYRVSFLNMSTQDHTNYKMLDVLPYDADDNGSSFNGDYLTEARLTTGSADLKVFYTTSEDVRETGTVDNLDETLFKEAEIDEIVDGIKHYSFNNEKVTAILLKGTVGSHINYNLDIILNPTGNIGTDIYVNKASMSADGASTLTSSKVEAKVYDRSLSGVAWMDDNRDGIMDMTEMKAKEIAVKLYSVDADGKKVLAINRDGNDCITYTDDNGFYSFERLDVGNYVVEFTSGGTVNLLDYLVSPKEATADETRTSKAEPVLNQIQQTSSAEVRNVNLPTLTELADENTFKYEKNHLNTGFYKITLNKSVTKIWDDNNNQDGIRPDEIKVQLYANDKKSGQEVTLSEANSWKYTFSDLAKYENGKEIKYTVKEVEAVKGYADKVELDKAGNFTLTNSHMPVTIEKSVTKVWDDNNDQDGIRPDEVKIQLYADEKAIGQGITLNEANSWKYTFSDLAKYENGKEIKYTVKEVDVEKGYTDKMEVDKNGNFTVTNSHSSNTTDKPIVPDKPQTPDTKPTKKPTAKTNMNAAIPITSDSTNLKLFILMVSSSSVLALILSASKRKKKA
jgi:uncharacterized repeat protein (TIGR01451 family)